MQLIQQSLPFSRMAAAVPCLHHPSRSVYSYCLVGGVINHITLWTHHTQIPFHQARSVPQGTKKTVCDAWNGYHAVPLHPDDKHFRTFITPWVAIGTAQLPKDTWRPAMASHGGSIKLSPAYLTRQSVLIIPYCGQTALTRPSGRQCSGWILVVVMSSRRTLVSLCSVKTLSSLPDLKYHLRQLNHARRC